MPKLRDPIGSANATGWLPVFDVLETGGKIVLRLHDWVNGNGEKPTYGIGQYASPDGYTDDIEAATDLATVSAALPPGGVANQVLIKHNTNEVGAFGKASDFQWANVSALIAGSDLVSKLEALTGDARLNASAIADFPPVGATEAQLADIAVNTEKRSFPLEFQDKLDDIEDNATADQTAEEIKDDLESLTDDDRLDVSAIKGLTHDGEANVQANWLETDVASHAYIENKPITITADQATKLAGIEEGATAPSFGFRTADGAATDAWQSKDQAEWNDLDGFHNDNEIVEIAGKVHWWMISAKRFAFLIAREAEYLSNTGRGEADAWITQWLPDSYVEMYPAQALGFTGDHNAKAVLRPQAVPSLITQTQDIESGAKRWKDTYMITMDVIGDVPDWLTAGSGNNLFRFRQTHAPLAQPIFPDGDTGDLLAKADDGNEFKDPVQVVADTLPRGTNDKVSELKWSADGTCVAGTEAADGTRTIGISGMHSEAGNELGGFTLPDAADFSSGGTDYKVGLLTWTHGVVDGQVELGVHPDDEGSLFEAHGRLAVGRGENVWFDIPISSAVAQGAGDDKRLRWTGIDTGDAPTTSSAVSSNPSFSAFIYCGQEASKFPPSIDSPVEQMSGHISELRGSKRLDRMAIRGGYATHTIFEQKEPMTVGRYDIGGTPQNSWGYAKFPSYTFGSVGSEDDLKFPFRNSAGNITEITVKMLSWQVNQGGTYNAFLAFDPDVDSEIVGSRLIRLKLQHRTSADTEWMDVDDFSLFGFTHSTNVFLGLDLVIIDRTQEIIETYPQSGQMRFAIYSGETPTPWENLPHQDAEISDEDIDSNTDSVVIGQSGRSIKKYVDDNSGSPADGSITKAKLASAVSAAIDANTAKNTYPTADETKLSGIEAGAQANQTAAELKTSLETLTGDDRLAASAVKDIPSGGGEANVQTDWDQTDSTADDFLKNKPTLALTGPGYSETLIGDNAAFTWVAAESFTSAHDLTATAWQNYDMLLLHIEPSYSPQGEGALTQVIPTTSLKILNNTAGSVVSSNDVPAISNLFTLSFNKTSKMLLAPKRKSGQTDATVHDADTLRFAIETADPSGITRARIYGLNFNIPASSYSRTLIGDNAQAAIGTAGISKTATAWNTYDALEVCIREPGVSFDCSAKIISVPDLLSAEHDSLQLLGTLLKSSYIYQFYAFTYITNGVLDTDNLAIGLRKNPSNANDYSALVKIYGINY